MFYKFIKIVFPVFLLVFLVSCGKTETQSSHSCCSKPAKVSEKGHAVENAANNSLYQLTGTWKNQDNKTVTLGQLKGKVTLVAMIFTHCGYACPKMVDNMKAVEKALPDELKSKVGFVLVSFDPERDTASRLKQYAEIKGLDKDWSLLYGDKSQVRILSMLLQLQYSQLPNGDFNHSNILTVLDENGAIVKQFEGLDLQTTDILETITAIENTSA